MMNLRIIPLMKVMEFSNRYRSQYGLWGWGNGESQYYTSRPENAFIQDGKLVIKAIAENYSGSNYTSARLTTKNKGDWNMKISS